MGTHATSVKSTSNTSDKAGKPARRSQAVANILRAGVQPKLKIGATNDPAEIEADRVADQVMRMPTPVVASAPEVSSLKSNGSGASKDTATLQRKCTTCDDDKVSRKAKADTGFKPPIIRRHSDGGSGGGFTADAQTNSAINSLGSGTPLPATERAFFEPRFGQDLSGVRIHTGGTADTAASAINARAFSLGNSIAFANGQYQPGTHSGRSLMAHEITHTLQGGGIAKRKPINLTGKQEIYKTHLEIFNHLFLARAESWKNTVRDIGSAFAIAKEHHENTIKAQNAHDALNLAVMWGAVTMISGGLFSWASSAAQATKAFEKAKKIIESVEDAVQIGIGEGIDIVQSATNPNAGGIAEIPLVYQNNLEKPISTAISRHHTAMQERLSSLVNGLKISDKDIEYLKEETEKWKNAPQPFIEHEKISSVEKIAIEYEKRIWAKWAHSGGLKSVREKKIAATDKFEMMQDRSTYTETTWIDPGVKLEERFDKLGITKAAGITDYGYYILFGTWTDDETITKLDTYLTGYNGTPITKL